MHHPTSTSTFAVVVLCGLRFLSLLLAADGHAYLMEPVSRNFWYTTAYQRSSFPEAEFCPHCYQSRGPVNVRARAEANTDPVELALYGDGRWPHYAAYERGELAPNGNYYETDAISVRHGICGDPEQTAAEGNNMYGQGNSVYPVLDTYHEGSIIAMKVVMSTYHWGHLEFFICNAEDLPDGPDSVVTQGCFNMHPLDRAEDDGDASPIDPNHKGRYYVDPPCRASETDQTMVPGAFPGDVVTARYQLPEGLTCDRCIVQMVYYTGNSCRHPGYDKFDPPSWPSECAPKKADWITLDPRMCGETDGYPEEFWNCADIAILAAGGAPAPTSPSPGPDPAVDHTPVPTMTIEGSATDSTPYPTSDVELPWTGTPVAAWTDYPTPEVTPRPVSMGSSDSRLLLTESPTQVEVAEGTEPLLSFPTPEPTATLTPEPTRLEEPSPSPTVAPVVPVDEPTGSLVSTLAPATFAPLATYIPQPECSDPITGFAQCGGRDYDGPRCCRLGFECVAIADCYSECRPIPEFCSEGWGQCGGRQWDGPTCCWPGAQCVERNLWYSQCVPETSG